MYWLEHMNLNLCCEIWTQLWVRHVLHSRGFASLHYSRTNSLKLSSPLATFAPETLHTHIQRTTHTRRKDFIVFFNKKYLRLYGFSVLPHVLQHYIWSCSIFKIRCMYLNKGVLARATLETNVENMGLKSSYGAPGTHKFKDLILAF